MKKQLKEYGKLGIYVYLVLYIFSMSSIYYLVKTKRINPEWVLYGLETLKIDQYFNTNSLKEILKSEYSTIAFTIICNRMTLIIRLPITIWLTIMIKRISKR